MSDDLRYEIMLYQAEIQKLREVIKAADELRFRWININDERFRPPYTTYFVEAIRAYDKARKEVA